MRSHRQQRRELHREPAREWARRRVQTEDAIALCWRGAGAAVGADGSEWGQAEKSSKQEVPEENEESQKSQARTLEGSTAPHCEHVFVTGAFCAADAPTPVRSETG